MQAGVPGVFDGRADGAADGIGSGIPGRSESGLEIAVLNVVLADFGRRSGDEFEIIDINIAARIAQIDVKARRRSGAGNGDVLPLRSRSGAIRGDYSPIGNAIVVARG